MSEIPPPQFSFTRPDPARALSFVKWINGTIDGMPRVFLIGFMGAGKSTTALHLAELLGCPCVDLDAVVEERAGMPIRKIFAAQGEDAFRRMETQALQWAVGLQSAVVALGGGAFCFEGNRRLIQSNGGVTVFLDPPWTVLEARLPGDNPERPKFASVASARALYEQRQNDYRRADLVVGLDGDETPDEVAARIVSRLEELACAS